MTAKVAARFAIGDLVNVRERKLAYYGEVREFLPEDRLIVRFKEPREPNNGICCDKCGWPGGLSTNGGTGEVVCMHSGCGHEHGFREWDEVVERGIITENITDKREKEKLEEKKNEARMKIRSLPLSQDATKRILDALEKELAKAPAAAVRDGEWGSRHPDAHGWYRSSHK